ncbi:lipase family alpha/beta hydrolase [Rubrivivax albus]|uniref:Alpha/beta fold hydrolase n=1 Tax=Rubrivivax albus TaxID=2499835 RepID=A0A3S2ULJ6_9BURK|nr:alpha/beta fold hydrolase [Rubrivivax albus]RVT48365.1 alpha/beta fold hydrolase [Rubrivivax albus]
MPRIPRSRAKPESAASAPAPSSPADVTAPGPWLLMLEARAPWELAALLAVSPWLRKMPAGDGHPVIVFPGLGASDTSTLAVRQFLRGQGYTAYPWGQGFNLGPRDGVLEGCRRLIEETHVRHGEPVSLIGWSLGGIYAREMAKEVPDLVRCVITLGTPFTGHPRATNAWRFYEMVSGQHAHDADLLAEVRRPPPVPTTSIYSKTDGIVAWPCSLNPPGHAHTENIEVHASHIGMGMNPLALYAIADRLRQDPRRWRKFDAQGARRWFFKVAHQPELLVDQY